MRNPPRLITPPGSNPALGLARNAVSPRGITPLSYSPQPLQSAAQLLNMHLTTQGDPGRGPGYALADHVHPPAVVELP